MCSTPILAILLLATPLAAQTLPEAPKPRLDRIDWVLLANDAGARALDGYSTHRMLCNGNHERFLPAFVVTHIPTLVTFEGGMVALNYFAARTLVHRRHPKLAKLLIAADLIQVYPWGIHNLSLTNSSKSRQPVKWK